MSWIDTVSVNESTGPLKELYDSLKQKNGYVPNILAVLSLKPESLFALNQLRETIAAGGSSLGRRREELINFTVAKLNGCRHCIHSHGAALQNVAADVEGEMKQDWRTANLPAAERVMLEFCEKITVSRQKLAHRDIVALRSAGFSDVQILEVVLLTAYRHFMNIVADALGVDDEPIARNG